ncbi:phage major tail tube protein [Desulfovibrio sp. OttesenSCG-928-G11]|nr:phage major tail tube protein [Desulfovibrio sp. OttesenSCG-928-G11]
MPTPEQTIAFRIYKNAGPLLGVATAELPQVGLVTDTISGSGIAGEYESPAMGQTSSMTCKLTWISQTAHFYDLLDESSGTQLELRASVQQADETTGLRKSVGLRVSLIGALKSAPLGSLETGKKQGNETELEVTRLRVELGGAEKLLIDKLAMLYRVNGNDALKAVREQLGLEY